MGPTILTVPSVLARIFAEAGEAMSDRLDLRRLDPQWRCFFEDGAVLDLDEDIAAMALRLRGFSGAAEASTEQGYVDFLAMSEKLHEVSKKFFFWRSVEDIGDTMDLKKNMDLGTLRDVMSLRMGSTVAREIRKRIGDERVSQMLDHFAQYVGSSPYLAPAVLCSIAHMQVQEGIWYPMGGTRAVPDALTALAERLGVDIRLGTGIARITQSGGRADGVVTEAGETVPLSAVVSNMDSVRTYRELVGGAADRSFTRRRKREAGLLRRGAVSRPRPRLRPPAAPRLRLLARSGGGVRLHLQEGRAGAGPDLLRRRTLPHRARRSAARRRGALRAGAHALSAAAPRLDRDAAGLPPASSSTSWPAPPV